jgi:methionine-rich copper-binding protein CopC
MFRKQTLAALSIAALLIPASPASAHTSVSKSNPARGAQRKNAPKTVWVEFGEPGQTIPFSINGGKLRVINPCGKAVHKGDTRVNSTRDRLTVDSGGTKKGFYKIKWRAVAGDGDTVAGTIRFKVTSGGTCS